MKGKPGGSIQGTWPSLKLKRGVRYSSTLERDCLFVLEYEPTVVRYQEQPFEICGSYEGREHRYTPDYAVWTTQEACLIECKPTAQRTAAHTQQQIALGSVWAAAQGWRFEVVTDTELRAGARLANLKLLWRYSRLVVTVEQWQELVGVLRPAEGIILEQLAPQPEQFPVVLALLFQHHLATDLAQPLQRSSWVWRV